MVRKCSVPGCTFKAALCQTFPHPYKDCYKRFRKWVEVVGNQQFVEMDPLAVYSTKSICRNHFTADCFIANGTLKKNAIPNKDLPASIPYILKLPLDLPPNVNKQLQLLSSDEVQHDFGVDYPLSGNSVMEDLESISDVTQISCRKSGIDREVPTYPMYPVILDNIEISEEKFLIDESGVYAVSTEEFLLPDIPSDHSVEMNDNNNCVVLITNDCLNSFRELERTAREELGAVADIEWPLMKRDYSRRRASTVRSFKDAVMFNAIENIASQAVRTNEEGKNVAKVTCPTCYECFSNEKLKAHLTPEGRCSLASDHNKLFF